MPHTNKFMIQISPSNIPDSSLIYNKNQKVRFINIYDGVIDRGSGGVYTKPLPVPYTTPESDGYVTLLDYIIYNSNSGSHIFLQPEGYRIAYISNAQKYDIFRREVSEVKGDDNSTSVVPLTSLNILGEDITNFNFKDYKISNGRKYEYIFYPNFGGDKVAKETIVMSTKWDSWSITEMHPLDSSEKKFYVTTNDVWLFNFNVETGEQTQNITRQENITLGQYPRYSEGRQNYINGSVSCLMGSEMVSAKYLQEKGVDLPIGQYVEDRIFNTKPTSNQKVDMLNEWRKVVKSKNPKLLKDRKGQLFVVTLNQSSNKPYDNIINQPDVINFTWTEIMSPNDIFIINKD